MQHTVQSVCFLIVCTNSVTNMVIRRFHARTSLLFLNLCNRVWVKEFHNNMAKDIKLKDAECLKYHLQLHMLVDNDHLLHQRWHTSTV